MSVRSVIQFGLPKEHDDETRRTDSRVGSKAQQDVVGDEVGDNLGFEYSAL